MQLRTPRLLSTLLLVCPYSMAQAPPPPGSYTLVLLPDTQVYSETYPQIFTAQTQWIRTNRAALDIRYVLHLGDITNRSTIAEWNNARASMGLLDGIVPYAMAPGNHDYSLSTRTSHFNDTAYFGPGSPYASQPSVGGFYEAGHTDNSYHLFSAGGRDWIILALEFGPRDAVVSWARQVLASHPNRTGIVITHAYMYSDETRYDHALRDQSWNPHNYVVGTSPEGTNDGQELWDELVRDHNVALVLNGHVLHDGTARLTSIRDDGEIAHQMLSNYQSGVTGSVNGGDGFLRLLHFLPDGRTIQVRTYSPYNGQHKTEPDQHFTIGLFGAPLTGDHRETTLEDEPLLYYRLESERSPAVTNLGTGGQPLDGLYAGPGPRASEFDGALSRIDTSSAVPDLAQWSITAWVRTRATTNQTVLTNDRSGWNDDVLFGLAPETSAISTVNRWAVIHQDDNTSTRTIVESGVDAVEGWWYHIAATSDGDVLRLYVDGDLVGATSRSGPDLDLGGAALRIGASLVGGGRPFDGTLAEVALYPRELDATEITRQLLATRSRVVAAEVRALGPTDPNDNSALSTEVPAGSFPGVTVPGANEGDLRIVIGRTPGINIRDGVLMATVAENERNGLHASVEVGRNSFSDGIQTLSITEAGFPGGLNEVNFDTAVAWFPFRGGWRAAHVNPDGSIESGNGVQPSALTLTGSGRFHLDLGVDSRSDGMLFTIGGANDDNIAPTRILPNGAGWDIRVQDNATDSSGSAESDPFCFVYLPRDTPGLIGGRYDGVGDAHLHSTGQFEMSKLRSGEYRLRVGGESPQTGMLLLTVSRQGTSGSAGPVAYWTFDSDLSSAVSNALFQGTAVGSGVSITSAPGEFVRGTGALRIDGGTGTHYVDITSPVIQPGQEAFTITAWYRYRDIAGNGSDLTNYLWETSDPNNVRLASGFCLANLRTKAEWYINDVDPGLYRGDNGSSDDGNWHHVAVTWSKSAGQIGYYWDGALVSTTATGGADLELSDGLHIGNHRVGDGLYNWDGFIDDMAVFDFVVSGGNIAALHSGATTIPAVSNSSLSVPDDKVLSYQDDGQGGFLIQSRDLPAMALEDTEFVWAFIPWTPRDPTWRSYGSGWPGTLGVPELSLAGEARLDAHPDVKIGNSLGSATQALLFIGMQRVSIPLLDGTLLVSPFISVPAAVPVTGAAIRFGVPVDETLVGGRLYYQAIELDSGASMGFSFTPGMELRIAW